MEFPRIAFELRDHVATLTLNHPEVLNATTPEMVEGLGRALDVVEAQGARCVVLTGAGRAFCSGANLQGRPGEAGGKKAAGVELESIYHPMLRRFRNLPCPVVSAINGVAAGIGMSLALMGDLILAARSAYFLHSFRRVGLVPDGGSTWILPRRIGMARAMELSLLGERLSAETALAWGLINRVCDDAALAAEARALAQNLAGGPTVSLGMTRQLYWASAGNSYEEQLDLECRSQRKAAATADFREGVAAFLAKRPPAFRGE